MEFPLFSKEKDYHLVRPRRIAVLEWLRAVRHNLYCEFTLLADGARLKAQTLIQKFEQRSTTKVQTMRPAWINRLKGLANGKKAAQEVQKLFGKFHTQGTAPALWPIIFVCGLLIGVGLKYLAEDTLTIGYEDYTLDNPQYLYDLNTVEETLRTRSLIDTPPTRKTYPACALQEF